MSSSQGAGKFTITGNLTAILSALLCCAGTGIAAEDRLHGPIERNRSVSVQGSIDPRVKLARDGGVLEPGRRINGLKLVLVQSGLQRAALEHLLEEQRDPSSPDYQNWLTPQQYGQLFGLSENDLSAVSSWLQSEGFDIEHLAQARNYITFNGTSGQIARTFHTELHRVEADGETHFASLTEPWIPVSLAGIVGGIRGLDDFRPKPARWTITPRPALDATNGNHYLSPDDLAVIYDIQALYNAGFDGTGQKLVIAGQSDVSLADVRAFRAEFNLPAKDPQLVLFGSDPGTNSVDQVEADLDLEWSGAVARNATIIYVYSRNAFDSIQYAIDQNLAPVISSSYVACESGSSAAFRTLAQQANAQGITWMNSSGDSGAAGCDTGASIATHGPTVTFPADIPEVTAIGGTEFNEAGGSYWSPKNNVNGESALSYIPEKAWNDTTAGSRLEAGGGGPSLFYAKPWWQTGPGVPNDQARDVPDLSLAASADHDGFAIYSAGAMMGAGGTSASTPAFAGIVSILTQYLAAKGKMSKPALGNINPVLYNLAQKTTGLFHDITAGDNIVPCLAGTEGCANGSFGYTAGPGYDLATGLGSVDAFNLVTNWTSLPPVVGTVMALAVTPNSAAAEATIELTATLTALSGNSVPTGTVKFARGNTTLGSANLVGSGQVRTATLVVNAASFVPGVNCVTATYVGTAVLSSATATVTVSVSAPPTATATVVTASLPEIAQDASTVLTATIKQASGSDVPTGTVAFTAGNRSLGTVTLVASASGATATLTVKGTSLIPGANTIAATYTATGNFSGSSGSVTVTVRRREPGARPKLCISCRK